MCVSVCVCVCECVCVCVQIPPALSGNPPQRPEMERVDLKRRLSESPASREETGQETQAPSSLSPWSLTRSANWAN